jgi:RNA polymerase sigma-70 factor, ECF subfamily
MDQQRETEIISRVLNGDHQAYALLVEEYKSPIYNLAYRMTGNLEDADDLTQEIFIRAYKNLWRFDLKKRFYTWLYTISTNLIRNHLKKVKNEKLFDWKIDIENIADKKDNSAESDIIAAEKMYSIESALMALEFELRTMIIMKYQQELSFEDIVVITGKTISAVKMKIYRGLEKLNDILQ